jgi:hypothetical protein
LLGPGSGLTAALRRRFNKRFTKRQYSEAVS